MAKHRAPYRKSDEKTHNFATAERDRLHHIAQTILNVSMPPNTIIYLDVCQQIAGSQEPAVIQLDCKPEIDQDYEVIIAQAIIDAFPIHGYVGTCKDGDDRLYKCLYHTPENRSAHRMMADVAEAQSILGEGHSLFAELGRRATSH